MIPLQEPEITYITGILLSSILFLPPGSCFFTCFSSDTAGVLQAVEDRVWNDFIHSNTDLKCLPHTSASLYPSVVGRSLFEFIRDPKVQSFFRHVMLMVSQRSRLVSLSKPFLFKKFSNGKSGMTIKLRRFDPVITIMPSSHCHPS
jgi:hypothetical protein